jgi:hypothetical protein
MARARAQRPTAPAPLAWFAGATAAVPAGRSGRMKASASTQALNEYLTTRIALLPGLNQVDTIPVVRMVKRSGLDGHCELDEEPGGRFGRRAEPH